MKDESNFFYKIFGPFGEAIQAVLAFVVLIALFMSGPILVSRIVKFAGNQTHSTPATIDSVQFYQKTDSLESPKARNEAGENISFTNWISKRSVIYDIVVAFIIAFFFYWLGKRQNK